MAYDKYNTNYIPNFFKYKNDFEEFDINNELLKNNIENQEKIIQPIEYKRSGIDESMFQKLKINKDAFNKNNNEKLNNKENIFTGENISSVVDFGVNAVSSVSGKASSNKENDANTINLAVSGAKTGMMVGGPIGAGIGAVIGTGMGLIDKAHDKKIRYKEDAERNRKKFQYFMDNENQMLKMQSGERNNSIINKQQRFL